MATPAFLKLKGKKQGPIKGSVKIAGREGQIAVVAVSHDIVSPRDIASGQATGKRQHKPLIITKELDKATPILYAVLTTNEVLSEFVLNFYGKNDGGTEVLLYTITLTNATVTAIHFEKPNVRHPDLASIPEYEVVAFTYQRIEWVWADGNIIAMDDWTTPS